MKWIAIAATIYVAIVVIFETFLATAQPAMDDSGIPLLVLTSTDSSGVEYPRRLARLETDGRLYVSAHHWPRVWYRRALENPEVRVSFDGTEGEYTAVAVEGEEHARVAEVHPIPLPIWILMGMPPERQILRLDPRF